MAFQLSPNPKSQFFDDNGNPLNADGNIAAEGEEPALHAVPSREEIYVSELYFAGTPDAPRAAAPARAFGAPAARARCGFLATVPYTPYDDSNPPPHKALKMKKGPCTNMQ